MGKHNKYAHQLHIDKRTKFIQASTANHNAQQPPQMPKQGRSPHNMFK